MVVLVATAVEARFAHVLRSVALLARSITASHTVVRRLISSNKHIAVTWQARARLVQVAMLAEALVANGSRSAAVATLRVVAGHTVERRRICAVERIIISDGRAVAVDRRTAHSVVTEALVASADTDQARGALFVAALLANIARLVREADRVELS